MWICRIMDGVSLVERLTIEEILQMVAEKGLSSITINMYTFDEME